MRKQTSTIVAPAFLAAALAAPAARAQSVPWDIFADPLSDSVCDLINAANGELVVLTNTGELVLVTGNDIILDDTFVDLDGFVFFEGAPAGVLDFATDGDGFRTLWWLSLNGRVVEVDGFTGEPFVTNQFPSDFVDVPCDACPFWDDQRVCGLPPEPRAPIFNLCGIGVVPTMAMTLAGLCVIGFTRRR